jgi:hypothetical protein
MHERGAAHEAAGIGDGDYHREHVEIQGFHRYQKS